MSDRWHDLTNVVVEKHCFSLPPQSIHSLRQPTSVPKIITDVPHYLSFLVGEVGVVTTTPLRTSASAVVPVLSYPTNVTAFSDAVYCAAPVSLSVWVLLLPGPPYVPPNMMKSTPISLSVLVGGGVGFFTWTPLRTYNSSPPLSLSVLVGGGVGVDTWAPSRTPDYSISVRPGGEGWCCYQVPLTHPQLRRGFRSTCEIQLTLRIPTQMSSVGSPATDSRLYRHDLCCNRNTAAQPIQIEEKDFSMNAFIVQQKEIYLRLRVVVVSITMPLAVPNVGVPNLSMDYPQASRHELRCRRLPLLFLILRLFLIKIPPLSSACACAKSNWRCRVSLCLCLRREFTAITCTLPLSEVHSRGLIQWGWVYRKCVCVVCSVLGLRTRKACPNYEVV